MKPGDKLPSEHELMTHFSVGRSSLREAVKVLSAIGLVEVSVGEGMFVGRGDLALLTRPLTLGLMIGDHRRNELIDARRFMEVGLAGLAAERATEAEIRAIGTGLEAMRETVDKPERFSRMDLVFHLAIAKAAHNHLLFNMLHTLRHILGVFITTVVVEYDAHHMPQVFNVHVPIYEAIRARDPKAAQKAMAAHLDRLEDRLSIALARRAEKAGEGAAEKTGSSPRA